MDLQKDAPPLLPSSMAVTPPAVPTSPSLFRRQSRPPVASPKIARAPPVSYPVDSGHAEIKIGRHALAPRVAFPLLQGAVESLPKKSKFSATIAQSDTVENFINSPFWLGSGYDGPLIQNGSLFMNDQDRSQLDWLKRRQ